MGGMVLGMSNNEETETTAIDTASLSRLINRLQLAKNAETDAKSNRLEIEQLIITATGFIRPEGNETYKSKPGDATEYSVTIKQPWTAKVDTEKWEALRAQLPGDHVIRETIKTIYEVKLTPMRGLAKSLPGSYRRVAACFSRKPGKIAVEINKLKTPEIT